MALLTRLKRNPMMNTLLTLKGNPRACLYTEPLWGIPYQLYIPYFSVYMIALGMTPEKIGFVASLGVFSQMIFSVLSGVLTDKLGRMKCTLIFDTLSWSIPMALWAFAQDYTWFLAAGLINGAWRITMNSWHCLLVEDADQDTLVHVWSLMYICGQIAVFVSPLSVFLMQKYSMVPTMRVLLGITCVSMTVKFIILYFWAKETKMGVQRMAATQKSSIFSLIWECRSVFVNILKTPRTMLTIALMAIMSSIGIINDNFWPLMVTSSMHVPTASLAIFRFVRSIVMLISFFTIVPYISSRRFERPMMAGWGLNIFGQGMVLITALLVSRMAITPGIQAGLFIVVVVGAILEALAITLVSPMVDTLGVLNVDPNERARIYGMMQAAVMMLVMPFGAIGGWLSQMDRAYPLALNIVLFALGACVTMALSRVMLKSEIGGAHAN